MIDVQWRKIAQNSDFHNQSQTIVSINIFWLGLEQFKKGDFIFQILACFWSYGLWHHANVWLKVVQSLELPVKNLFVPLNSTSKCRGNLQQIFKVTRTRTWTKIVHENWITAPYSSVVCNASWQISRRKFTRVTLICRRVFAKEGQLQGKRNNNEIVNTLVQQSLLKFNAKFCDNQLTFPMILFRYRSNYHFSFSLKTNTKTFFLEKKHVKILLKQPLHSHHFTWQLETSFENDWKIVTLTISSQIFSRWKILSVSGILLSSLIWL